MVYLLALSYAVNARQFGERKIPLIHCFGSSVASAFRTLDWEIPNCRAILAGVMPAFESRANGIHLTTGQCSLRRCPPVAFGNSYRLGATASSPSLPSEGSKKRFHP